MTNRTDNLVLDRALHRRIADFSRKSGPLALHLAYHAALPVALDANLLHLLRINFFLDPPEILPYTAEVDLLLSPLCIEIRDGLYEMEPVIRDLLLTELFTNYSQDRIRDLATLLWQYTENYTPWEAHPGLQRAQQLTALNFLEPQQAQKWLDMAETSFGQGPSQERQWFVVMRQDLVRLQDVREKLDEEQKYAKPEETALEGCRKALRLYQERVISSREVVMAFNNIAEVYRILGKPMEVLQLYEEALQVIREVGDRLGEGTILSNMAEVYSIEGRYEKVLQLYEEVFQIMREVGDRSGEEMTLNNMAGVCSTLKRYEEALWLYEQALSINQELGDRSGEGATLYNLAFLYQVLQRYKDAATAFENALLIFQQVSYVAAEIATLVGIAILYATYLQRTDDAKKVFERAIALFQSTALPQDAAGATLADVQQMLLNLQSGASLHHEEQGVEEVLVQAIYDFVNADDWDRSQQHLEANQALLLQPEVEALFAQLIQQAKEQGEEDIIQTLEIHLALLKACQRYGIAQAFAQLRASQVGEEQPSFDSSESI